MVKAVAPMYDNTAQVCVSVVMVITRNTSIKSQRYPADGNVKTTNRDSARVDAINPSMGHQSVTDELSLTSAIHDAALTVVASPRGLGANFVDLRRTRSMMTGPQPTQQTKSVNNGGVPIRQRGGVCAQRRHALKK